MAFVVFLLILLGLGGAASAGTVAVAHEAGGEGFPLDPGGYDDRMVIEFHFRPKVTGVS
jgi:hypothetical protein